MIVRQSKDVFSSDHGIIMKQMTTTVKRLQTM